MPAGGGQAKDKGSRPARVQIYYELETRKGAVEKKELPFVMFSIADLKGKPEKPREKLKDRKAMEISNENFDKVMKSMAPRVDFEVPNVLPGAKEGEDVKVQLSFESLKSFSPDEIAKNVPALRKLLDARNELQNLLTYADANQDFENLVNKLRGNDALLKSLMAAPKPNEGGNA